MSAIRPWIIALLALPAAALAAGGDAAPADPVIAEAQAAVSQQDFAKALEVLRPALAQAPANADYHNLYAYAVRKSPAPDLDLAFRHYREALRLEPKHRGAHEYIGEAYLMVGNLAKAKEHLARLDDLCFFGCAEYTDLKKAIAAYEAKPAR
jgi:Flp pilus assembly protein TadD